MISQSWTVDRARGMIWGAMIADAVGAAYEHYRGPTPIPLPDFLITREWKYHRQYAPHPIITPAGMITDDSELTIASLRAIARAQPRTLRDTLAEEYLAWGASACPFGGRNTRKYLYGIGTMRGLESRIAKFHDENANSESNGFLMRASPFALLSDATPCFASCELTGNYNDNCARMFREYIGVLRDTLGAPIGAYSIDPDRMQPRATHAQVVARDTKGWGECAILCCRDYIAWIRANAGAPDDTYMRAIRDAIGIGGDTDTNGAIVGAIAGARFGMARMMESEEVRANVDLILHCTNERKFDDGTIADCARPLVYHANVVDDLIMRIYSSAHE